MEFYILCCITNKTIKIGGVRKFFAHIHENKARNNNKCFRLQAVALNNWSFPEGRLGKTQHLRNMNMCGRWSALSQTIKIQNKIVLGCAQLRSSLFKASKALPGVLGSWFAMCYFTLSKQQLWRKLVWSLNRRCGSSKM